MEEVQVSTVRMEEIQGTVRMEEVQVPYVLGRSRYRRYGGGPGTVRMEEVEVPDIWRRSR